MNKILRDLAASLEGELYDDTLWKHIYATDASVYRSLPLAVAYPKTEEDIQKLIRFAHDHGTSLIPRTAGTSLAGQCVGAGIVVDVSKYFTRILKLDQEARTVLVQPGVIRDDLNRFLQPYGLFFGPNTSTSNRCMIGGMVGNNSSGTTSIKYGVTRDKVKALKVILSDGSPAHFSSLDKEEYMEKMQPSTTEARLYKGIYEKLKMSGIRERVFQEFPKPEIHRRNTGYAVDLLLDTEIFGPGDRKFNMCELLAGSEGTLAFTTEILLELDPLPPAKAVMVAAHFDTIEKCLSAVVPAMKHNLFTCEMMDKVILDCTKNSLKYRENRFFIEGDPAGILMLEIRSDDEFELLEKTERLIAELEETGLAYALPVLKEDTIELALELRKAGLGLLGNIVGDKKAVACIEDTAVSVEDLSAYIEEFTALMKHYGQQAVYYAHAGAGELHLRPILNLKKEEDVALFRRITHDVSLLVKKYRGSMSGEHGDGRVRAEFIEMMIGKENYLLLQELKHLFDPENIFNPGKIVDAAPMDESLRYLPGREEPEVESFMDFSESLGILRGAENCNGSGDCRKPAEAGGTMCPSYRATRNEKDTTRARANALREFLTHSEKKNRFDHVELKEVLELCISCKGCKSECPSNVDMAAYKAEFEYQYKKVNGSSLRTKVFAYNTTLNKMASVFPRFSNQVMSSSFGGGLLRKTLKVSPERLLPAVSDQTLSSYYKGNTRTLANPIKKVYLFNDEFTNYTESEIGVAAIRLLEGLNYEVEILKNKESGRSFISKGFLKQARDLANYNINLYREYVSPERPLIGIEPSAILSFRDEYLRLAEDKPAAEQLSKNTFLFDEFFKREILSGNISAASFSEESKRIKIHGHCHQKSLSSMENTFAMLNLPINHEVTIIPSGCCGMAGSFGYEQEHYNISMQIGEQTLFPAIRKAAPEVEIAAPGTSCRHQIKDGTGRRALHPIQIMERALLK